MKKSLRNTLIIGGAVLVVGYFGLTFFLGSVVRAGVNQIAPRITGTKVELESAEISPLSGSGTLKGFVVGNPKGWSDANLVSIGRMHMKVRPFSVLGDHIVIDEIVIESPEFLYETKVVSSNVGDLLKNIQGTSENSSADATTKSGKPLKFEVKHFHLEGGKVTIGYGAAAIPVPMPPIDLTDLGTAEGGITSGQLAVAIMRSVTTSVATATADAAKKLGGSLGGAATDTLKSLFGGKKK
jgi:uncharacterized protein involved in outer membrane biogenesis